MASAATSARLRYLHDAASQLFVAAPTSAAAFEAEVGNIAEKAGLTHPDSRRREICSACGNILAPGLSCTVATESAFLRSSKCARNMKAGQHKPAEKIMVYTCKRCSKSTRVSAGVPPKARRVVVGNTKPDMVKMSIADPLLSASNDSELPQIDKVESRTTPPTPSGKGPSNAGSKQRAKARKQSGLQALLAKNKASASTLSGSGLDLMDFMKMG